MSMSITVARPPRKDKKKEIKTTLSRELYTELSTRCEQHEMSLQAYCAELSLKGLRTERVIRAISPYFKRGYVPLYDNSQAFIGKIIAPDLDALLPEGELNFKRQSVKYPMEEFLEVCDVANALVTSNGRGLAILLNECLLQRIDL